MLVNLQYLRALAALMVVLFHALDAPSRLGAAVDLPRFASGAVGVDLFFVISGFIIWRTARGAALSPARFAWRRAVRVVPLYWALTLFLAATALLAPGAMGSTRFDAAHLLASLLFLPWPHPSFGTPNPVLFVGWTLNYEMAFYALFALVLPLAARWRLGAALLVLAGLPLTGWWLEPEGIAARFYTQPVMLQFAIGLLLAAGLERVRRPRRVLGRVCLCAGLAALVGLGSVEGQELASGLAAALVVGGAVLADRGAAEPPRPLARGLGDASYSIYLTHPFVLPLVQIGWSRFGLPVRGWAGIGYPLAALVACALTGLVVHALLERPLAGRPIPRFGSFRRCPPEGAAPIR